MRIAALGAAFLNFVGAISPVMALDEATITNLLVVDDSPLVIGIGDRQLRAVGC